MPRFDPLGSGLPLAPHLGRVADLLGERGRLVLQAPPGTGKSTLLPAFLIDEPWVSGRRILMLEPRRVAAAAVAARVAELRGTALGGEVGYRVRGDARSSRAARLEVITEGLLVRMMQEDPSLAGVGLVIFDEFHERSIHSDLALAMALDIADLRSGDLRSGDLRSGDGGLRLLVMSATIEGRRAADFLGAELLEVEAPFHPIVTAYIPPRGGSSRPGGFPGESLWPRGRGEEVARAIAEAFAEGEGDLLAFLPGMREIREVEAALRPLPGPGAAEVLVLHGALPLADQRRVVAGAAQGGAARGGRRIVLATNIAETSLTVAGVRTVVDAGLARVSRYHPGSGLDRLAMERVSAAAAEQRRGRAGRLGPGRCYRLWPEAEYLSPRIDCEIARVELSSLVLEAARWGVRESAGLRFLDPPPRVAWDQAKALLALLGLLDGEGAATPLGERVLARGMGPRAGLLAEEGRARGAAPLALLLAAFLGDRDLSGEPGCDLAPRLEALLAGRGPREWRQRLLAEAERAAQAAGERFALPPAAAIEDLPGLLLAAYPDRLGKRVGEGLFKLLSGRQAALPKIRQGELREALHEAEWLVAVDADPGEATGVIRLALAIPAPMAEAACAGRMRTEVLVEWVGLAPRCFEARRAGALEFARRRVSAPDQAFLFRALAGRLDREGAGILPWSDASRALLGRLRFLLQAKGEDPGPWTEAVLAARAGEWLAAWIDPSGGPLLDAGGLLAALRAALPPGLAAELARAVPERFVLPSGAARAIDYADPARPLLSARVQDFYGLDVHPRSAGVPIVLELLSPAGRPVQITADLPGYWRGSWKATRVDMKGRYPKHDWPEEPWRAPAKPRGGRRPG